MEEIKNRLATLENQEAKIIEALQQLSSSFSEVKTKLAKIETRLTDLEGRDVPQTNFDDSITGSIRNLQQDINSLKTKLS